MLQCRGVTIGVHGRLLCEGLELAVGAGEVWAVLGPNGSGKTTLMHVLAGVRAPDAGAVCWRGKALQRYAGRERARHVALLPQHEQGEFWGTVLDYVLLGRYPRTRSPLAWHAEDMREALRALDECGLAALGTREYGALSGGERQRVRLAQVVAQDAACALLDEPLAHLDLAHQARVLALARSMAARGRAVVMVLHDALWAARLCSHALLLDGAGGARSGPAAAVLTRPALEALYGCRLREFAAGDGRYMIPEL